MSGDPPRALAGPTDARPPFHFSAHMRVGFDETDAQAVVYYGRYFPYFDRARVEYARHLGVLHGVLGQGQELVMRRASCEYEAPARFDDMLEVFVRTAAIGRTSLTAEMAAYQAGSDDRLAQAQVVMVLIDVATRRPARVPDGYRAIIDAFEGAGA